MDDRLAIVGRIEHDETIHRGTGWNPIGSLRNRSVYDNDGKRLADVDSPGEAAALLLLL